MSDKTNERLEQEARESLVAADLSAKMKQWRNEPTSNGGGNGRVRLLVLLLVLGGITWWFWPDSHNTLAPAPQPHTNPRPDTPDTAPISPTTTSKGPMALKSPDKHYLALAQSNYHAPDFQAEIRGNATTAPNALQDARQALADQHPADALDALKYVDAAYETNANYLRAHALFELKKYAPSAALFAQLKSSVRYGEAAEWYEVLALLPDFEQNKGTIMARLKAIAGDPGHTFQREGKALLETISASGR